MNPAFPRRTTLAAAAVAALPIAPAVAGGGNPDTRLLQICQEAIARKAAGDRDLAVLDAREASEDLTEADFNAAYRNTDAAFRLMGAAIATPAATLAGVQAKAALAMAVVRFDKRRMPVVEDSGLFWSIVSDVTRGVAP